MAIAPFIHVSRGGLQTAPTQSIRGSKLLQTAPTQSIRDSNLLQTAPTQSIRGPKLSQTAPTAMTKFIWQYELNMNLS